MLMFMSGLFFHEGKLPQSDFQPTKCQSSVWLAFYRDIVKNDLLDILRVWIINSLEIFLNIQRSGGQSTEKWETII